MAVRLIIDSSADATPEVRKQCIVVPLTLRFGDKEYIDGVTIDHQTFYQKLVECADLPTTSQASPDAFAQEFQKVVDAGDQAVVLTLSSCLSGTYQSACIAAMDYPDKIHVVDSRNVAIGTGILAELALSMIQNGGDAKTVAETLMKEREQVCLLATLDTLEYLKKGGRISKTVAFAGELLSIKPLVSITEGAIAMVGKARGARQANAMLSKEIEKTGGVDHTKPVLLGYTGRSDEALEKYIADSTDLWAEPGHKPHTTPIGSIIGTHAGPGAVATAFFRKA